MKACLLFLALLAAQLPITSLAAESRTALVMGVWEYTDPAFPPLRGIDQDVKKMSAKLRELGFSVTAVTNPTLGEAKNAVDAFGAKLKTNGGAGLFYFSGHGSENDGKNYLIPKGTRIKGRRDLDDEALSAQRLLIRMEDAANRVNLVFLDCCRNAMTKGSGGLAPMQGNGVFIGFATASEKEASASDQGSPYTIALLENLGTSGTDIKTLHTRVTRRVKEMTSGEQVPFEYSGLDEEFYMVPRADKPSPVPLANAGSGSSATRGAPFTNSLGMKFVPVPGTKVLFCIHDTRKSDYRAYANSKAAVDDTWQKVDFKGVPVSQGEAHPVVNVSWENAKAFCAWLSAKEGRTYRLPTDHEWSCAVGIGDREDPALSPKEKSGKIEDVFPWGTAWPPPKGAGNFSDSAALSKFPTLEGIDGYTDGYATTSPVMSFAPNPLGLYDMGGNVSQWCEDWYEPEQKHRVLRGGSWRSGGRLPYLSSFRVIGVPHRRFNDRGFRVVMGQ